MCGSITLGRRREYPAREGWLGVCQTDSSAVTLMNTTRTLRSKRSRRVAPGAFKAFGNMQTRVHWVGWVKMVRNQYPLKRGRGSTTRPPPL